MESKNIKDTESTNASDGMLALESVIADVEVLCRSGQPKVAIKTYKSWIKSSDSHDKFIAQFNLGVLLVEQGDLKMDENMYKQQIKIRDELIVNLKGQIDLYEKMINNLVELVNTIDPKAGNLIQHIKF